MTSVETEFSLADCDKEAMEQFLSTVKSIVKEIKEFNIFFTMFLEQQKKLGKDLWNWVTKYNILDCGPPCVYPIIQKEELLQEMLVKIQDGTSLILQSLKIVSKKHEHLSSINEDLETQALILNWDEEKNPSIKGGIKHRPISNYLEYIAEIIFKLDVSIACMFQYFDCLNLHNAKSYENLMKSFSLSTETVDFIKEFLIKCSTLFNC